MVQNYKCMESKRTQLDLLTVKIMGRKQKLSRIFGRALGRHRNIERQKYVGRPIYQVKHSRKRRNENLKITIRKLHRFYNKEWKKNITNASLYTSVPLAEDLRLKICKVKDLSPKGYRFMNLDCLQSYISEITLHVCLCIEAMKVASEGKTPIKLETEVRCYGLASVMSAQYQGCYKTFKLDTSPRVPGSKRFNVNVRAVWGSMVAGNGPAHLN
jgi:hypothetical protein